MGRKRFLLIGDNTNSLEVIKEFLKESPVSIAYQNTLSGTEAKGFLNQSREKKSFPDIIVIDFNRSEMEGLQFIMDYEQDYFHLYPDTKLFFLTNFPIQSNTGTGLQLRCVSGFITKPVNRKSALQIVS